MNPSHHQMKQFVRLLGIVKRPHSRIDGSEYDLFFELGSQTEGTFEQVKAFSLLVQVSGTLEATWRLPPAQMGEVAAALALPVILEHAREGTLDALEPFKLNTYTAPRDPPAEREVEGSMHPLPQIAQQQLSRQISFLSEDISEVRDQINALAKSLWGDRILLLSQERPLLDMYKSAENQTDFRARIQSLGIIAKDLNRPVLAKVANLSDFGNVGDFILLENALQTLALPDQTLVITTVLKQVNALRQGYPAHGDNADRFLGAHRHFGLPYPVLDYSAAWEKVLGQYFASMKALLTLLSAAWQQTGMQ
ncbi:MAG: hypothetical protein JWR07_4914 [Nevskia sp.]|nr:hypothetical protein [Nevskia sp.]